MSGQLLLVNPRRRKARSKNPSRKRRTSAQRAATRKLVALNRSKRASNPIRRRRRHTYRAATARRRNPISSYRAHRRSRRRSNPIGGLSMGGVMGLIKTGAMGAGGALAVDLALGYLPLPATMVSRQNADGSTNFVYYATKGALAIAIGTFGKKLLGAKAVTMAEGAMIVNMYDLFRTLMPAGFRLGYFNPAPLATPRPAMMGVGAYIPGRAQMGAYIPSMPGARNSTNPALASRLGGISPGSLSTRGRNYARS